MNTDIRFLQQLEDDLDGGRGARERAVLAGAGRRRGLRRRPVAPPSPARAALGCGSRRGSWPFLVLAGSIGFLTQGRAQDRATSFSEVGDAVRGRRRRRRSMSRRRSRPAPAPARPPMKALPAWQSSGNGTRAGPSATGGVTTTRQVPAALPGSPPSTPVLAVPPPSSRATCRRSCGTDASAIVVPTVTSTRRSPACLAIATSLRRLRPRPRRPARPEHRHLHASDPREEVRRRDGSGCGRIGEVEAETITGQDVTAEFIDQTARLQILLDRRDLLQSLQSEATTISEILRLAGLIEQTQLEIEKTQGQLRYLKNQVAEATIKVDLRERHAPDDTPEPDHRQPQPGRRDPTSDGRGSCG